MPFDGTSLLIEDLVVKRIRDAIDCIEKNGWCQKALMDEDGRVCLLGAFKYSSPSGLRDPSVKVALRRVASVIGCNQYQNIWQYNDRLLLMTGKYVILDVLHRALEATEN
jgi:hypothetical protein